MKARVYVSEEDIVAQADARQRRHDLAVAEQLERDRRVVRLNVMDLLWVIPLGALVGAGVLYFVKWFQL